MRKKLPRKVKLDPAYPIVWFKVWDYKHLLNFLPYEFKLDAQRFQLEHFLFKMGHWKTWVIATRDKKFRKFTSMHHYLEIKRILDLL